ncbi:hypothetical protein GOP47_0005804 [Adiantum capillus-veneris]|uniref:Uncharacterized protein n=1 Tax=Adiantum capillus-veneris TaxID=13818 RepID=A0A9D4V5R7_ADICA|nr:hypothetical protein GOP47_0005804 [Adiantum capillus-veneris]
MIGCYFGLKKHAYESVRRGFAQSLDSLGPFRFRKNKGKLACRYLVKFMNYPVFDAKWIEEDLVDTPQLLELYLEVFGLAPTIPTIPKVHKSMGRIWCSACCTRGEPLHSFVTDCLAGMKSTNFSARF